MDFGEQVWLNRTQQAETQLTQAFWLHSVLTQPREDLTHDQQPPQLLNCPWCHRHGRSRRRQQSGCPNIYPSPCPSRPNDIVPIVEFLALPSAQWITGQTIWINGGYLTR